MEDGFWGLAGVVVGGALSLVGTYLVGRQASSAAARLDREQRQDNRRLAFDDFQRTTLLELQDAVEELASANRQLLSSLAVPEAGSALLDGSTVPPAVRDAVFEARRKVHLLVSRVADDDTRELVAWILKAVDATAAADRRALAENQAAEAERLRRLIVERAGVGIRFTFRGIEGGGRPPDTNG